MSVKKIYGIDLGTTYSCVSHINKHGLVEVIDDRATGERLTPSVVFLQEPNEDGVVVPLVGSTAKEQAKLDPGRAIKLVKRHMPKELFRTYEVDGITYDPVDISAMILKYLAREASARVGEEVTDVVITVPAYFGSLERERTEIAGRQAGLVVHDILPEPMAAALHYDVHEDEDGDETILVYDLGGGTFDVTIIAFRGHAKETLAIKGDHNLGGFLWDEVLAHYWAEPIAERAEVDVDEVWNDPQTRELLQFEAEVVKKRLSGGRTQTAVVAYLGRPYQVTIDRATFDGLTSGLLDRTISLVDEALEVANRNVEGLKIDRILLVGGSTLMPQVKARLEDRFGTDMELLQDNPHYAVALGAAKYAQERQVKEWIHDYVKMTFRAEDNAAGGGSGDDMFGDLPPDTRTEVINKAAVATGLDPTKIAGIIDTTIIHITPKSFGVKHFVAGSDDPMVTNLIRAQERVPALGTKRFGTRFDSQEVVELVCIENDRELGIDDPAVPFNPDEEIGMAKVHLAPGLPAGSPIDVTIEFTESGLVRIHGRDAVGGREGSGEFVSKVAPRSEGEIARKRAELDRSFAQLGDGGD